MPSFDEPIVTSAELEPGAPLVAAADQMRSLRVGRAAFLGLTGLTAGALLMSRSLPGPIHLGPNGKNVAGFFIYTIGGEPVIDLKRYRLRVTGMVEEPREYTYEELRALPAFNTSMDYHCVTGWTVPNVTWTGTRLWDVVMASRPKPKAHALNFTSLGASDSLAIYTESLTFPQAQQRNVMIAYGLNRKVLTIDQGYPARLVVPGMYGYKYAKWLTHIQVVDKAVPGYWEQFGYDINAYLGTSHDGTKQSRTGKNVY